jgi:DNA polymerase III alpha subunit (gram-positive type)
MIATVFDTETSGLIENRTLRLDRQPEIIEFYACAINLETGEMLDEFDTLIKPKKPVSDEITQITTITNDMLQDAEPFSKHANRIQGILERSPSVIAHNLAFDKDMVEIEFQRLSPGWHIEWPECICTVEQTNHIKGYRLSLSALHQTLFGEPFEGAHRAKVDVQALLRCSVELFKRGDL